MLEELEQVWRGRIARIDDLVADYANTGYGRFKDAVADVVIEELAMGDHGLQRLAAALVLRRQERQEDVASAHRMEVEARVARRRRREPRSGFSNTQRHRSARRGDHAAGHAWAGSKQSAAAGERQDNTGDIHKPRPAPRLSQFAADAGVEQQESHA